MALPRENQKVKTSSFNWKQNGNTPSNTLVSASLEKVGFFSPKINHNISLNSSWSDERLQGCAAPGGCKGGGVGRETVHGG